MDLHAPRCGEPFHAVLTLESFNACVDLHVGSQGALDCKGTEALLALVGFFMSVNTDMTDQIAGLFELFGAVWTAVPPHTILLPDGA